MLLPPFWGRILATVLPCAWIEMELAKKRGVAEEEGLHG